MTATRCVLQSNDLSVTMLPEFGARVHSIEAFGVNVLRTPPTPDAYRADPFYWGGYHMAPWCNRLDTTRPMRLGACTVNLAPNFPDGSAIHGQVLSRPWAVTGEGRFAIRGGAAGGWPWTYDLTLQATVSDACLWLEYALTNTSKEPMPAALGLHPWLRQPALVRIPARTGFAASADTSPEPEPMTGALDLRVPAPLPVGTDACWTSLTEPAVEVTWPAERITMTITANADDLVIVAAHPAGLAAIAVEPQTHAPAGLRRLARGEPHALQLLQPDRTLRFAVTLAFASHGEAEAQHEG
jgi:aldose 1-epimerase